MSPTPVDPEGQQEARGWLLPPLTTSSRGGSPSPTVRRVSVGPLRTAELDRPPVGPSPPPAAIGDEAEEVPFVLPWRTGAAPGVAEQPPEELVDLNRESKASSSSEDALGLLDDSGPWDLGSSFPEDYADGEQVAETWALSAEADAPAELDLKVPRMPEPFGADQAATWEFDDDLLPRGEAQPEDEQPVLAEQGSESRDTGWPDAGLIAHPPAEASDATAEAEVAERLERIARSLRERGLAGTLREHGADPLGAIVGAYLSGYLQSHRQPSSSG
jgi:hypothetical protein